MRSTLISNTQTARHGAPWPAPAPLRIGVMCTVGPLRFTPFLTAFRLAHPGIEFTVVEGVSAGLKAKLEAGAIAAAVMAQPEAYDPRFDAQMLYRERFALACPPAHRLARQRRIALAELDGENYVERVNCEFSGRIDEIFAARNIAVRTIYESEREDWVQMMVMSGAGIAMLPEYSVLLPGLCARPIVEPSIERDICLVALAGRAPAGAAAVFAKSIRGFDWSI